MSDVGGVRQPGGSGFSSFDASVKKNRRKSGKERAKSWSKGQKDERFEKFTSHVHPAREERIQKLREKKASKSISQASNLQASKQASKSVQAQKKVLPALSAPQVSSQVSEPKKVESKKSAAFYIDQLLASSEPETAVAALLQEEEPLKHFEAFLGKLAVMQAKEVADAKAYFIYQSPNQKAQFLIQQPSQVIVKSVFAELRKQLQAKPLTFAETVLFNALRRADQIAKADIEEQDLLPLERLRLAFFIESASPTLKRTSQVFTRAAYNLPRTLHYNKEENAFYLVARHRFSKIKGKGTFKIVSAAARLKPNDYAEAPHLFVRAVTKGGPAATPFKVALARDEAALTQSITDQIREPDLGIVTVHTVCEFVGKGDAPKLSTISPAFEGDVQSLVKSAAKLSTANFLRVAKGMAKGLRQLHDIDHVHLDIKPANAVYKEDVQSNILEVKLIDLGLTSTVAVQNMRKGAQKIMKSGFYGSPALTSFELLGNPAFTGDLKKADVYALGVSLYQLYFKERPPWMHEVEKLYKKEAVDPDSIKKEMQKIDDKLKAFESKPPQTPEAKIERLIYKMLCTDPEKRIGMQDVCSEFDEIENPALVYFRTRQATAPAVWPFGSAVSSQTSTVSQEQHEASTIAPTQSVKAQEESTIDPTQMHDEAA